MPSHDAATTANPQQSNFKQLRAVYVALAVYVFNTLVFVLVAVAVMAVMTNVLEGESTRVYSQHFLTESYELSTLEEAHEIGLEFDRMGEQESYAYNPWTTFTERTFQGRHLNIEDAHGYPTRATVSAPLTELDADREDLLIWAFGGSTMLGWGVSDKNTVASHLQAELANALPDRKVQVVNHGHAYYVSSQEVSLFVALLRKEARPDIAVFLDGLNDVSQIANSLDEPYFAAQAAAGWEAERQRRYDPQAMSWVSVNASFPLFRMLRQLKLWNPPHEFSSPDASQQAQLDTFTAERRITETMRINRDIAGSTSERLGIKPYFFLQPIPDRKFGLDVYKRSYATLGRAAQRETDFHDISGTLNGTLEHPYVDLAHYSDRGSLLVAQRMAKKILLAEEWVHPSHL